MRSIRDLVIVVAVVSFATPICLAVLADNIRWFGVGGGMLAIFAILTLFCEYSSRLGIGGAKLDP
jgi:hypothetical protein